MASSQPEKKNALLPGFGRPLNYVPLKTDPDYVGDLFKNALSMIDLDIHAPRRMPLRFSEKGLEAGPRVAYVA